MGFFSWKIADSKKSIPNSSSKRFTGKPVYLLQPDGQPPIEEPAYEGYGEFGGVDAFVWLAEHNLPKDILGTLDEASRRDAGIVLDSGDYVLDKQTGKAYTVFHPVLFMPAIEHLGVKWSEPLEQFDGKSANALVEEGRFAVQPMPRPAVPLKFSFKKDARYEDLPESATCPKQGYFYD